MVLFVLYVKADLENVGSIEAPALHRWCLDIKEPTGDETREGIWVSDEEELEVSGSRGTAHFLMKWPGAKKESQLTVVRDIKKLTRAISANDSGEYVPLVGFECRGIEPVSWSPEDGYKITCADSGTVFENVNLSEDWAEYDEEGDQSVGVYAVEHKFEVRREK
ncbi:hypothetical protein SDRG_05800 [Saprolegnia diclina VS20]|uniref:DUF866 domain-containing protein n=1 Tax=Saprolegnia diclina (strain VS20) TaxID=1156394 RepID=T0QGB2_SAPDV|nr:hypothetical protein SDRG_05800 [Saprolegnia diclina VS20]EQC36979.1 hypothetical protein SDRG_05800 [Saprolegnia diclina VS20]|eukprot:XP_008609760.1 hypothetical protein SDRG_05800 [Saprolegnia diclina VS20]